MKYIEEKIKISEFTFNLGKWGAENDIPLSALVKFEYKLREEIQKALKEQRKQILDCLPPKISVLSLLMSGKEISNRKEYELVGEHKLRDEFLNNIKQKGL